MVFNWFRRKFDNPEPDPSKDSEQNVESAPEQPETPAADETATEPVSTEVATDYLAWAKAAYQNIQQQESAAAQAATTVVEEVTEDVEPVLAIEEETTEPLAAVVESEESAVEAPTETSSDTAEDTTADVEDLPIWARDDRQQRLEQLKASAIETVEPEAQTPDIELDDDFLWSAKVLADRGRTPEQVSLDEINWLKKLRQGLDKTRRGFVNQLKALIGQGPLNADAVESIETLLLQADVGIEATDYVIETLQAKLRQEALPPEEAIAYLKQILRDLLDKPFESNYSSEFLPESNQLNIWLLVGVNGVGKTTTIGKLAHMSQSSGYKCLIAAGDTFRAAAVEQVKVWGQRSGIEVIANPGQNPDPAAVVFDAISAARSRETELLLVDTAGRLQNKKNLMDELSKIRRIIDKQASTAQIESLLVLDATLGQNGLRQAQVFAEAAKLSGVILTKLDGTAKGGVALAVVQQLGLPIRFIGAGEGIEDLRPFSSYEFVEALLSG
ncbi:signal recognition particle-docking protein FtsY [Chamaesiphon polymorphus]|uniref:Signal recognition particle receptor FtsY n=1 Tax=Chamaesiphon polymorphus CCALA 037 TaxID=2107692 RepID=A0A2T1GLZ1_9CYAN|nr:signal recognition particle-docking protein FtsY [Chamaesiphon polymorphus]PSB58904.1 signal recognition particle-docking protein FtsY [Chamaesiphon polymorphus CCALA 037]